MKEITTRLRSLSPFLHPVLLSLWPALALWKRNEGEVALASTASWLAALGAGSVVLVVLLRLLLGEWHRASWLTSAIVLGFHFLPTWRLGEDSRPLPITLWFLGFLAVLAASVVGLRRWKGPAQRVTVAINVAATGLCAIPTVGLALGWVAATPPDPASQRSVVAQEIETTPNDPDIYYVILDAYGRGDVLNAYYGFDNEPFLTALEDLGFFVARRASSNYSQTQLSIPSSLNMAYLHEAEMQVGRRRGRLHRRLRSWTKQARVPAELRKRGYRYEIVESAFAATQDSPLATRVYPCPGVSEWSAQMIEATLLRGWKQTLIARSKRGQILCQYDALSREDRGQGPRFVLAHILSPHSPWLFDRNGDPPARNDDSFVLRRDAAGGGAYVEQVLFNNAKVLGWLKELLADQERPSVVILQSDHGPGGLDPDVRRPMEKAIRRMGYAEAEEALGPGSSFAPYLWARMGILNALYLPGIPREVLPEELSPVNTFRVVFDHYFDTHLGLRENRSYYSFYERPNVRWDVTATLRSRDDPPPRERTQ